MIIDILINSCARPDITEVSLKTFMKHIKSQHEFRYIILEDNVEDEKRQAIGRAWINENIDMFDEVYFAMKKMGPGYFFEPVVQLCKSDYFFHLEDDNEFIVDINIDIVLEFMQDNKNVLEVLLSRGKQMLSVKHNPRNLTTDGLDLTEMNIMSVATGLFNTSLVRDVIDYVGPGKKMNESKSLTPASEKLGLRKFVLGHNEQHYVHVGEEIGYRKGVWKR